MNLTEVTRELHRDTGIRADAGNATPVGGGSISNTYRVPSSEGLLFAKLNQPEAIGQFEAEVAGLKVLCDSSSLRVPAVISFGTTAATSYLFLEWLEFSRPSADSERALGRGLAAQHRVSSDFFGWQSDNFIGPTVQPNSQNSSWTAFLRECRLGYQLGLAGHNGLSSDTLADGAKVLDRLDGFFDDAPVVPSLLHGDLWAGNWAALQDNRPSVFDPAVYFGDREADLAMTRLFGGFGDDFYAAYCEEWPLRSGWERRVDLYNLYHVLNHFNIFGAGYLSQVKQLLEKLAR